MPDSSEATGQAAARPRDDRDFVSFERSDIERPIPELFERQARRSPQALALVGDERDLSYDELDRLSNRIAQAILRCRGEGEEPVGLLFRQGPEAVAAILGVLKAGKIYVPLEPSQSASELRGIIAHCQPGLIITQDKTATSALELTSMAEHCLDYDGTVSEGPEEPPPLRLSADRDCYIFYTSGTTGPPKGVVDRHRNVLHNIMRYTNSLGIGADDRLSLIQSCGFSGTVSSLFSALLNGAAICPFDMQGRGIARLGRWLEEKRITVFHSTPAIFEQLMAQGGDFSSLRLIRLEGDRAAPRHIELFRSRFGPRCWLVNGLGLTEAGLVRQHFVTPSTPFDGDIVPAGRPVEDMEVDILDDAARPLPAGEIGEIAVRSRFLARGYWRRPDLTEAAFAPDPSGGGRRVYRTGDLGRLCADGRLDYLGRKDGRARLRGQWVDTAEIESALSSLDAVDQALVLVRDDERGAQHLVAYLVVDGGQPSIDGIRQRLAGRLPSRMIPSHYLFIESLPLDRNGKVDRRWLPAPRRERPPLDQGFVAPMSYEETLVAACFREVLNIDRVGIHDDFLDLGGDSLSAMQLLSAIEEKLGVECPDALISHTFSVTSLIGRLGQSDPETALVLIRAGDERPPLFAIHGISGYVLNYHRLAACLNPGRTIYGLQSRALTRRGQRDEDIEAMAAAYLAEIKTVQETGPYFLCGNCFGGLVAFEIAQQLRRQGHDVALVALIDTAFPGGVLSDFITRLVDPHHWRYLSRLPVKDWGAYFARRLRNLARWAAQSGKLWLNKAAREGRRGEGRSGQRLRSVLDRNGLAQANYRPRDYDGHIVLFCPGPLRNRRGWTRVASGGTTVVEIPYDGSPQTVPHLISDPYVAMLAAHLSDYLDA
jgi:amino acid adenylation domain-containing protein